ncbi:hypothetical protein [Streptomyces venezuelae]|uniref:hypothetical protein n=1 Tax=Streptomyces venezuelae TaxID=54571 RepID=UPI0033345589
MDLTKRPSRAEIEPARFAKRWLEAPRLALDKDECLAEHLYRALDQVFYAPDEHSIDLLAYNPCGSSTGCGLPVVGDHVTGVVVGRVDRDRQLRVRVGSPWGSSG